MIADIIEIERAKRSIRQLAIARGQSGRVPRGLDGRFLDGPGAARSLARDAPARGESAGDEIAPGGRLEPPFR